MTSGALGRIRWGRIALGAVPVVFLGWFFVYPLATILVTAGEPAMSGRPAIFDVLTRRSLLNVAWFTTWQAMVSTALTLLLGIPGAAVLARYEFRGRKVIRALTIVPFVLPTVVVGTAFLALLGPGGPLGIDLRGTVAAVLIAHVFYNYAVVVRTVGAYWEQIDPRIEEAARVLGASRWRVFRTVTLPVLAPAIWSAAAIVFLFTFTSFGVILILGNLSLATIEVEIFRQATALLNMPVAAALAALQLAGITAVLVAYRHFSARREVELPVRRDVPRLRAVGRQRWFVAANLGLMGFLLGAPLGLLVLRSFRTGAGYGLDRYLGLGDTAGTGLFVPPLEAVGNSLRYALVATVIATVVGVLASVFVTTSRGRTAGSLDTLLMLPLGTSAVTLGFGFLVALDAPIDLRTSWWLVPVAHALVAIPFVVRTTAPVMRSIRTRLRESAAMLGAGPTRVWREIDLPLVARAAAVGAGFSLAISLGEFGATSFIARPQAPTLPVAIFRLLGRPGDVTFGQAMALSVVLMVLTTGAVLLIERFRPGGGEDF